MSWPGSARPARKRPHSFRQNFLECNHLGQFSEDFFPELRVANEITSVNGLKQTKYPLIARTTCEGSALNASDSRRTRRIHFFFGKKRCRRRRRAILEGLFAVSTPAAEPTSS